MMPPVSNFDYLVVALREGRGSSCEGDWQGKGVLQYRRIVCPQCLPAGIASTLPTMPEIWSYPRARSPRESSCISPSSRLCGRSIVRSDFVQIFEQSLSFLRLHQQQLNSSELLQISNHYGDYGRVQLEGSIRYAEEDVLRYIERNRRTPSVRAYMEEKNAI